MCDFVAVPLFNLQYFVRVFSKTLIADCAVSFEAVMAHYFYLAGHIENDFHCPHEIFPPIPPMHLQSTYIKDKFLVSTILYRNGVSNTVQQQLTLL